MRAAVRSTELAALLLTAGVLAAAASAQDALAAADVPAPGAVTGTLVLDGKPMALRAATAISVASPLVPGKNAYTVALSPAPLAFDPRPADTAGDRLDKAFTTGITLMVTVFANDSLDCMLLVRDPSLGERRILKMHGCAAGAVTAGPDRVQGKVTSGADGGEESLSGHKVSYSLQFNAPIAK